MIIKANHKYNLLKYKLSNKSSHYILNNSYPAGDANKMKMNKYT